MVRHQIEAERRDREQPQACDPFEARHGRTGGRARRHEWSLRPGVARANGRAVVLFKRHTGSDSAVMVSAPPPVPSASQDQRRRAFWIAYALIAVFVVLLTTVNALTTQDDQSGEETRAGGGGGGGGEGAG